jgi:hypothetical protein
MYGEVKPEEYEKFTAICKDLEDGKKPDFESMRREFMPKAHQAALFDNVVQPYVSPRVIQC